MLIGLFGKSLGSSGFQELRKGVERSISRGIVKGSSQTFWPGHLFSINHLYWFPTAAVINFDGPIREIATNLVA